MAVSSCPVHHHHGRGDGDGGDGGDVSDGGDGGDGGDDGVHFHSFAKLVVWCV